MYIIEERAPGTNRIEGHNSFRPCLDVSEERKVSFHGQEVKYSFSFVHPTA
jgi:hypothetical protein